MSSHPVVSAVMPDLREAPSERIAALFDAHHHRIYRLARRLTSNADDALDLVQETFLRAARSPASVPLGARREEAWLVRVLVNIRRDQWRKNAVRERRGGPPAVEEAHADHEAAVIAKATVWRALDLLPPRRRAVLVMHELEGLDVRTVASQLGVSTVTVRWHLRAARQQLARVLTAR